MFKAELGKFIMQEVIPPGNESLKYDTHNLKFALKTQYEVKDETK